MFTASIEKIEKLTDLTKYARNWMTEAFSQVRLTHASLQQSNSIDWRVTMWRSLRRATNVYDDGVYIRTWQNWSELNSVIQTNITTLQATISPYTAIFDILLAMVTTNSKYRLLTFSLSGYIQPKSRFWNWFCTYLLKVSYILIEWIYISTSIKDIKCSY